MLLEGKEYRIHVKYQSWVQKGFFNLGVIMPNDILTINSPGYAIQTVSVDPFVGSQALDEPVIEDNGPAEIPFTVTNKNKYLVYSLVVMN